MSIPWGRDSFISVSNKPSGLFRRNADSFTFPWPEEGIVVLYTYWQRCSYHFITRIILFMELFLKLHFGERFMSTMYPKVIPSPGMAQQVHKKGNSWEVEHLPYKHCLWDWHIHEVVTAPSPFPAGLWALAARRPGNWLVCVEVELVIWRYVSSLVQAAFEVKEENNSLWFNPSIFVSSREKIQIERKFKTFSS